ncbi:uncharacterized protein isoform X2 [Choristoneura fumiferana]|uniref:uncharacterized protein isoform X2 n=1 Tax=Choristoneura fumiferana TaxID=7141 RepID=UPI003D158F19
MDVLSKFSDVTLPAHEKMLWWSHVTGANVRRISPEPWAHKSRPRSTSARSGTSTPNMRPRKMSASPPRTQSESMNVLNHVYVTTNAEISEEELWAACAGKVDPYFSCHPPSAPIEVLIIGAPPTMPNGDTLARHDLKAVWPNLELESEEHVWLTPRLLRGLSPRARPPRPSRARVRWCCQKVEGAAGRGARRYIRHLLRDIVAALPLLALGEEQENNTVAGAEVAPSVDASISAQAVPVPPLPVTRSVAVQTHLFTSSVDKGIMGSHSQLQTKNNTANGAGEKRARTPDAWVGGARALRDSHVRLVLRQLRHIERLNRALDHAVPALKHKQ